MLAAADHTCISRRPLCPEYGCEGTTTIQITAATIPGASSCLPAHPSPQAGLLMCAVGWGLEGRTVEGLQGWDRDPGAPSLLGPHEARQRHDDDGRRTWRAWVLGTLHSSTLTLDLGSAGGPHPGPGATDTHSRQAARPAHLGNWPQGTADLVPGAADYDRLSALFPGNRPRQGNTIVQYVRRYLLREHPTMQPPSPETGGAPACPGFRLSRARARHLW